MATGNSRTPRHDAQEASLGVWTRPAPGSRKPRFTREEIAVAAVRIADTEGFEALSMRRLAAELGAGTMTLYHYVREKDELLALLQDAVMGELLVDEGEMPRRWRDAITLIATRSRDSLRRHPWALDVRDDPAPGPNSVRHFDQSMQAVASLDIPLAERFELVTAVDEYVFGFCLHERVNQLDRTEPVTAGLLEYMNRLIDSGGFPALAALREDPGVEQTWAEIQKLGADPDRFHRNLQRLLDGFEAEIKRKRRERRALTV